MLLLELPDEILYHVLEACAQLKDVKGRLGCSAPGRRDIINFACTCHRANGLADPFLLRTFSLRTAKGVTMFLGLLGSDLSDEKTKHVRDLALVPLPDSTSLDFISIASHLQFLPRLEHLLVELPYRGSQSLDSDNKDPFEVLQTFLGNLDDYGSGISRCPVPSWSHQLITCHLNLEGPYGGLTNLNNLEFVIFAPRLRHLTFVDGHFDGFSRKNGKFSPPQHVTPLRTLSLESCSFTLRGISQLLSIPAALRSFNFYPHNGLIDHNTSQGNVLGLLSQLLSALATYQRHSLSDLSGWVQGLGELRNHEASIPSTSHISFNRLTHLSNLRLTLSEYDALQADSISDLFPRLPPSISHLHIEDKHKLIDFPWLTSFCRALLRSSPPYITLRPESPSTPQAPLPNLTNLTIAINPYYYALASPLLPHIHPDLASSFAELGHLFRHRYRPLRSQPIHFKVIRCTDITTAVPPYLWDEERPEEILVYDNMVCEDMWSKETDIEKEKAEAMRKRAEDARRQQEEMMAVHHAAIAAQAQAQAQAEAFTAQLEGGVTAVSEIESEVGLVQGQTNSA